MSAIDTTTLLRAAQLVDDLSGQREREESAFALGFRIGFNHGYDIGWHHGARDQAHWIRVDRDLNAVKASVPEHIRQARAQLDAEVDEFLAWKAARTT